MCNYYKGSIMQVYTRANGNFIVESDEGAQSVVTPTDENYQEILDFVAKNPESVSVYDAEADRQEHIQNINHRLAEIDREAIRPMRAALAGTSTLFDTDKLADLEAEADKLREELRGLLDE
jgi:hypothetical protein